MSTEDIDKLLASDPSHRHPLEYSFEGLLNAVVLPCLIPSLQEALRKTCVVANFGSDIYFSIHGPVSALPAIFPSYAPSLWSYTPPAQLPPNNFSMFSSAPFLQDVAVSGFLDQWRKLFAISVAFLAHHSRHSHPDANLDFYACVKEVGASWNLHFDINTGRIIRSSAPSDAQLLPILTNNEIRAMTLNGETPSVLDRYFLLNWKELFLYSQYLFRRSKAFENFGQRHRQNSSSPLTRADVHVARELTFEEGKLGILPELQRSRWRVPEGIYTFQDNSLLKIASSRRTRYPGGFTIKTKMDDKDVLSEDIIAQMR
ncbi:hypothetical protein ARMGADRAFT_1037417 [Armillaria gallica]|uniref:Uncharacterized protein n=1 Tax=Armillaria gallica TaxID=47427 RepID=A0A2H3CZX5_ARMGA|nr:hypothetical protein ARMGADRAFT_1037417 [Armillaria gallica]